MSERGGDAHRKGEACGESGRSNGAPQAEQQGSGKAKSSIPAEFIRACQVLSRGPGRDVVSILSYRTGRRTPQQEGGRKGQSEEQDESNAPHAILSRWPS